jgi:hypothetical protein
MVIPAEMVILAATAILLAIPGLEKTMLAEATRNCATIAGSLAISGLIKLTTNE